MRIAQPFTTPVLFIIFNRPDTTRRVFDEIRKIKPLKLYIVADGPREMAEDKKKCDAARAIVKDVDWDCEVKYLFRETNLGCGLGVATAMTWFFENEPEGIFLEDDSLPHESFFWYCQELLERYRDDERIMMISGNNFQHGIKRGDGSYYFSRYPLTSGSAGWRRGWKLYDFNMTKLLDFIETNQIKNIFENPSVQEYWLKILEQTYRKEIVAWDYQWLFTVWTQNGLSITPNVNLVSNIGYGHKDATNTIDASCNRANLEIHPVGELVHPSFIIQDKEADEYESKNTYSIETTALMHVVKTRITANNFSDKDWKAGVMTKDDSRNMFYFLNDVAAEQPVSVGIKLVFAKSGAARVTKVDTVLQDGGIAVFVTVDCELDPLGDGFPQPIFLL